MPTSLNWNRDMFADMAGRTRRRLVEARKVAGQSEPLSDMHRLHHKAVFALEDALFALEEMAQADLVVAARKVEGSP